jgi:hypothetical protein
MTQAQPRKLLEMSAKQAGKSKLLDSVREAIRVRHYSIRTEHTYVDRVKAESAWSGFSSRGTCLQI